MTRRPPRALLLSWIALLVLLTLTVWLAHVPLAQFNFPVSLAIATAKAGVVAVIFMELWESRPLTIAIAVAGVFWLGILLWLSSLDYTTRTDFPPRLPPMQQQSHAGDTTR